MSHIYLVLPRMSVRGMNAQPAWWCLGAPGPMAACGLAHNLALKLGIANALEGTALVVHDFCLRAENLDPFTASLHQYRAACFINQSDYVGSSMSLSGQPTARGDGSVSIVIRFKDSAQIDIERVKGFLRNARFAGGQVNDCLFNGDKMVCADPETAKTIVGSGFAFVDRMDLMTCNSGEDPLDAFLRATRRTKGKPAKHSWLTPYLAGYRELTPVQDRAWSRDGSKHSFVEPLVGLGQMVSLKSESLHFWRHDAGSARAYLVKPAI